MVIYAIWERVIQGTFLWSLVEIGQVVKEEMFFKEIVDDARRTDDDDGRQEHLGVHNSSHWAFWTQGTKRDYMPKEAKQKTIGLMGSLDQRQNYKYSYK